MIPEVSPATGDEVFGPEVNDSEWVVDEFEDDEPERGPIVPPPAAAPAPRKITGLDGKAYTPPPPRAGLPWAVPASFGPVFFFFSSGR